MRPIRCLLVLLFAMAQSFGQIAPAAPQDIPPRFLSLSAYLGINTTDPEVYPNMADDGLQMTLSARAQAQLDLPLARVPVFPSLGGYLTGEPTAWEAGGNLGLHWRRNTRETYGIFGGLMEKGHFDITVDSASRLERWHGFQLGMTGRKQSRSFARLGYVGLAAVQVKESYRSSAGNTGLQAYLGLEFGLI